MPTQKHIDRMQEVLDRKTFAEEQRDKANKAGKDSQLQYWDGKIKGIDQTLDILGIE